MKKTVFAFLLFISMNHTQAQQHPNLAQAKVQKPTLQFETLEIDFGKIKQGVPVERDFNYSNTGNAPLIISNARASCGCTTPKFSEAPLLPGKKDKIIAGFNAANPGAFVKTITVNSNATDQPIILKIKGEVVPITQ